MTNAPTFVAFYGSDWIGGTRTLSQSEKAVFIDLLALMFECGGPVDFDRRRLARLCGTSASAFQRSVDGLVDAGKIQVEGGQISNARAIAEIKKAMGRSETATAAAAARWAKSDAQHGQVENEIRSRQPAKNTNKNNKAAMPEHSSSNANQTQTQNKGSPNGDTRTQAGPRLEDFVPDQAAKDYRAHRVAIKAKLTPGAEKAICRELGKVIDAGLHPTEALETAAANGWRGFKVGWIINDKQRENENGTRPGNPRSRAEAASEDANEFWSRYDEKAGRGPEHGADFGGPEFAPDDGPRNRSQREGVLEGVVLRPAAWV